MLEDGRITAIGSHDELLTTSPTYRRLYQLQFMNGAEHGAPAEREMEQLEPELPQPDRLLQPATSVEGED